MFVATLILSLCMFISSSALAADAMEENPSGFPVPRFVSLKSGEVNVRTGPGVRYPIRWVYKRKSWPVEVIEEFDNWRRIQDIDGESGWVHGTMLGGTRMGVLQGPKEILLRNKPEFTARPVIMAEPRVLVHIIECEHEWCEMEVKNHEGWLRKEEVWGVYPEEVFD